MNKIPRQWDQVFVSFSSQKHEASDLFVNAEKQFVWTIFLFNLVAFEIN